MLYAILRNHTRIDFCDPVVAVVYEKVKNNLTDASLSLLYVIRSTVNHVCAKFHTYKSRGHEISRQRERGRSYV